MIKDEDLLFYDIEVFSHDCLIVFKDINGKDILNPNNLPWWSNRDGYTDDNTYQNGFAGVEEIIKGKIIVGYNNYYYDDKILNRMVFNPLTPEMIKEVNDRLINGTEPTDYRFLLWPTGREPGVTGTWYELVKSKGRSLDCMQQIDVSRPSLKLIEGNLGMSIEESAISFSHSKPLTDEEREEVYRYCCHDVEATIAVFKKRREDYFDVKDELLGLLETYRPSISIEKAQFWGTNTISASVLLENKNPDIRFKITDYFPEGKYPTIPNFPEEVIKMWESWEPGENVDKKKNTRIIEAFDCKFTFAFGGLHGINSDGIRSFQNVFLLDVGSMYPSIIIDRKAIGKVGHSESLGIYDDLRKERLKIKHSDPVKAQALKLVLNAVYGNLKYKNSKLYHSHASTAICVWGQMALFDLSRMLFEQGYKLINMNTDGIAFVNDKNEQHDSWKTVQKTWESRWNLYLELDTFSKWYQRDVNNYIAVKEDGSIKTKGGDVNKYSKDKFFSNNNVRIVQIGLVDYLLKDISPMETVMNHLDDPRLYQWVLKAGSTFRGICDSNGKMLSQKVNRVFASSDSDRYCVYKVREDGAKINFPDLPENVFVWNGDVNNIPNFKNKININAYVDLIRKKVNQWLTDS